jgi:hypothetical protein
MTDFLFVYDKSKILKQYCFFLQIIINSHSIFFPQTKIYFFKQKKTKIISKPIRIEKKKRNESAVSDIRLAQLFDRVTVW